MKKLAKTIILLMLSKLAMASCFGERFNLTQILLNNNDKHSIFSCQITKTYFGTGGYTSIAVVNDVFRGIPMDTVRIVTGGHTTAGGSKLKPGTNWLIISETQDNYYFTATICHNQSKPIAEKDVGCGYEQKVYGNDIVKLIKQVDELRNKRFTGSKEIYIKESLIASGNYLDGKAQGSWKHYNHRIDENKQNLELEIEYVAGIPNGKTTKYVLEYFPLTIESITQTHNEKLISKNIYGDRFFNYKYISQHKRITNFYRTNEIGDTIYKYQEIRFMNSNLEDFYLHYMDGEYINLIDSSSYNCLCRGNYYKGAKIGNWNYYDRQGNLVNQISYDMPDTISTRVKIFEEDGTPKVVGSMNNGKPIGKWKYYYDGFLEQEVFYNSKSEIITQTRHYIGGGKEVTPYLNEKKHGTEHKYSKSAELSELTNYDNGLKNGLHYRFDEEGNLIYHSRFKNNIETTILRTDGEANIVDGFKDGYNIQLNYKTGKKMHEGLFWKGYRIGKQIRYKDNGDYSVSYLETDKELIMNKCHNTNPINVEHYKSSGELIKIDDN